MKNLILSILSLLLTGCMGHPKSINPIMDFELNNYLGKWYEIARLDHSFERGLEKVTAEFKRKSKELGFATQDLIWVNQEYR